MRRENRKRRQRQRKRQRGRGAAKEHVREYLMLQSSGISENLNGILPLGGPVEGQVTVAMMKQQKHRHQPR